MSSISKHDPLELTIAEDDLDLTGLGRGFRLYPQHLVLLLLLAVRHAGRRQGRDFRWARHRQRAQRLRFRVVRVCVCTWRNNRIWEWLG